MKIILWFFICMGFFLILTQISSAIPFIVGQVNDALDGQSANGKTVVLWNPAVGINDNVTDIVGPTGNSGANNMYMIDCDLLTNGCAIGTIIYIKVINENYVTNYTNVTINGAGFQQADNLNLNSPPIVGLSYPVNYANFSNNVNFFCNSSDYDGNLVNVTLYGNWSDIWHANETIAALDSYSYNATFAKNIPDGRYSWSCMATDNLAVSSYSMDNYTLTIDGTAPNITETSFNFTSPSCFSELYVRVNCTVTDYLSGLQNVFFTSHGPYNSVNYSASLLSGDTYYADIYVNETGNWIFECVVNDTVGNIARYNSSIFLIYPDSADLAFLSLNTFFTPNNPIEGQITNISTNVFNYGCTNANNFLVGFYEGDPNNGGIQIGNNQTISVLSTLNSSVSVDWPAVIGTSNIFIRADLDNSIIEANESNNLVNSTINVNAWQSFYGNATLDKILANSSLFNISFWSNQTGLSGNIFVADSESTISWANLIPLGKNTSLDDTYNDFEDIDVNLNMTNFNDSVSNRFTTDGVNPFEFADFLVYQRSILNVPVINSGDTSSFITGILWDSLDDNNGEYDQSNREDLVFVSKLNKSQVGSYGIYDYEITIPARMREYRTADTEEVYFYFDLN